MNTIVNSLEEKHTADSTSIGFDYQFYYFLFLSLDLNPGESIGFEIRDDIHIEKPNGEAVLLQLKHSVQRKSNNEIQNLTERDDDLWKTINNWILFINSSLNKNEFINRTFFKLVTNKNDNNNEFISKLNEFNSDVISHDEFTDYLKNLSKNTQNSDIKGYINNLVNLNKGISKKLLSNLEIVTNVGAIIQLIKDRIQKRIFRIERVDAVYDSLCSNVQTEKFLQILDRKKFIITFDEFALKFGRCFDVGFNKEKLPIREIEIVLPENIESQIFIQQLLDIDDIWTGSQDIIDYTTKMIKLHNQLKYWEKYNYLLRSDRIYFDENSISIWKNIFKEHFHEVQRKILQGTTVDKLEEDIRIAALKCLSEIRKNMLSINGTDLGSDLSNGHFYKLSNEPLIGWHFQWQKKYLK